MPPCGSPLNNTTNSVPLPVSVLNGSSVTIREDRGVTLPMRSNASCGMVMRSSAAFALPGSVGTGSASRPLFAEQDVLGAEPLVFERAADEQKKMIRVYGLL